LQPCDAVLLAAHLVSDPEDEQRGCQGEDQQERQHPSHADVSHWRATLDDDL
jgi:hypothetical protein